MQSTIVTQVYIKPHVNAFAHHAVFNKLIKTIEQFVKKGYCVKYRIQKHILSIHFAISTCTNNK